MRFLSTHTVPAGAIQREQIDQMAQAARNDPVVQPYRSFINLSEGKVVCVMDAPNEGALTEWFQKMGFPVDYIAPVELEGDRGTVSDA
ncbi:MAG: nickel-binding protein [Tepidisphaeraceae bacterium]